MLFSASLLFRSCGLPSSNDGDRPLWENQIILIEADDEAHARELAANIGKAEELSYPVADGTTLAWRFKAVDAVFEIAPQQPLHHGTELFSRFLKDNEARSLLTAFND